MILAAELIPTWLNVAALVLMLVCLAGALLSAHWRALISVPSRQHVLFGGVLCLLLLWLLTVQVADGVWVHILGITSMTLIVGWRFTLIGGTVVLLAHLWWVGQSYLAIPVAFLFSILVPASITRVLVYLLRRYAMANLFVYMLGAGFGGGLLSILAMALLALPVFWLAGQGAWVTGAFDNWPLIFLMLFPEGFINGMLVTALTVFYPDVVKTFDDDYYLNQ